MAGRRRCPRLYESALGLAWVSGSNGHSILRLLGGEGPQGVWRASVQRLEELGLGPRAARHFVQNREGFSLTRALDAVAAAGVRFVPFGGREYPEEFKQLTLPPAGFFCRGTDDALASLLATPRMTIVGTRKATAYGSRAAESFSSAFAAAGVTVLSGMAIGVDTRVHKAALGADGLTVAILGGGADVVYPRGNHWLYERILEHGLVISELPPGFEPAPWTFPHRNRLLAALGDAVLVVEGSRASGALQTATAALELGRPVFAVPGSIYADGYRGCNGLLHEGANPAIEPEGAVEDFMLQTRIERGTRQMRSDARRPPVADLGGGNPYRAVPHKELVWQVLANGPCSVDGIVERAGLAVRDVTAALAQLELDALAEKVGPGLYARAP